MWSRNNLYEDIPNIKPTKNYTSLLSAGRVYKISSVDAFCQGYAHNKGFSAALIIFCSVHNIPCLDVILSWIGNDTITIQSRLHE